MRLKSLSAIVIAAGLFAAPAFADGTGKGPVIKTPDPLTPNQTVWNTEIIKSTETCSCDCSNHSQHIETGCTHGWSCSFDPPSGRVWHQPVPGGPWEIKHDIPMAGMNMQQTSHHSSHHSSHVTHSSHTSHVVTGHQVTLSSGFFAGNSGGVGAGVGQGFVGGGGGFIVAGGGGGGTGLSRAATTQAVFGGVSRGRGNRGRRGGRRGGKKY